MAMEEGVVVMKPLRLGNRKTGVYIITCEHDGTEKEYIGSAAGKGGFWGKDGRIPLHIRQLKAGTHCNILLQRAWDKYGENSFTFWVVEECPPEQCIEREQWWMDFYESANPKFGYNLNPTAGSSLGIKRRPESIAERSASVRGIPRSAETKARISASMKGKNKGTKCTPEMRAERSLRMMGNTNTRGHKATPETKAKLSAAQKRAWARRKSKGNDGGFFP